MNSEPKISAQEWREISFQLEDHHAIFYKIWEIGKPVFSTNIETAAIQFDKGGDFVLFLFNPDYWQSCTPYERLFIICHEALHCILNHGLRTKDTDDPKACNVALDIVVNHLLVRNFGFDRFLIRNQDKLCWVDTVFKQSDGSIKTDKGRPIPDDDCFEYYINLFDKIILPKIGKAGLKGGKSDELQTVDDHSYLAENDTEEIIDRLDASLSKEEKETIKGIVDKHFESSPGGQLAGTGTGGQWHFAQVGKVQKKKKWESVIKNWCKKYIIETDRDNEQWARLNRRFSMLPKDMFLPSEMEVEDLVDEKHKIKVRFYLDTSGSCWHLKDRFFQAAMTLPEDRFEVKLLCFDTTVIETDIKTKKMYGGGGTSFKIIENDVQKAAKESGKYPEAVFVMTDGWGDRVNPEHPERWYWFIDNATEYNMKSISSNYVPKECHMFSLKDFE